MKVVSNWLPTMLFNIALPIITYALLTGYGMADAPALALSGVWPLIELGISFARTRHADEFSIMVLVFLVIGVVASLAFNDARLLLVKDSAVTGLFGLVLLGSLLAPRPLMFYFGRKFATGGDPARVEWWNGLWQYPGFRRSQRILTVVWGAAFLGEAVLRVILSYALPLSTALVVTSVLPYVVLGLLIFGTVTYGRRAGRRNNQPAAAQ
ncbi:VC0807 family protein [Kutzneria sp. 744]|uniref:VC0807 family protein n=1 Tax=Kutzneria sp. (strain 744) TaxID=345341 RepID=UPI0003EEA955|nr:VC0807 family protein [Kutzneria sp. 744]EWM17235.1 membrane protein [Kutzneria sp. 744]